MEFQVIKFPEEVIDLLENLWYRHQVGLHQSVNNVFMVDLSSLAPDVSKNEVKAELVDELDEEASYYCGTI